jgi:hypothetical protein
MASEQADCIVGPVFDHGQGESSDAGAIAEPQAFGKVNPDFAQWTVGLCLREAHDRA